MSDPSDARPLTIAIGSIAGLCVLAFCAAIVCEQLGNWLQGRRERYERDPF